MATGWERFWQTRPVEAGLLERERRSDRWQLIRQYVRGNLGSMKGLRVIEVGSGMGTNSLCMAMEGACVSVLDIDPLALEHAVEFFSLFGIPLRLLQKNLFAPLGEDLKNQFDVAMSFGLAEHFVGPERELCIRRHFEMVRPGGLVIISVPNRSSFLVRLDGAFLSLVRRWPWGWKRFSRRKTFDWPIEVPFRRGEMRSFGEKMSSDSRVLSTNVGEGIDGLLRWIRYPLSAMGLRKVASSLRWSWKPMLGLDRKWGTSLVLLARNV